MPIVIGATSYVFRYLLANTAAAPSLNELLLLASRAGLKRFQVCENARPLDVSVLGWRDLRARAQDLGVELSLGCMTLNPDVIQEYIERVVSIDGSYMRVVLEREGRTPLNLDGIRHFLDRVVPHFEKNRLRLAIENHFHVSSATLSEAVSNYPLDTVGFCIDVANSLRNFEDPWTVFKLLDHRSICYHLKDYVVEGTNVGFCVSGAPFGAGQVDSLRLLRHLQKSDGSFPEIFLETWTPDRGDHQDNVDLDSAWLHESIFNLKKMAGES